MSEKTIVIIGSGPAGYTAAIYSARAGIKTILISGFDIGGQLTITTEVENYPGFCSIFGPELMEKMKDQAIHCGVIFLHGKVESIQNETLSNFSISYSTISGESQNIECDSIIVATGAQAKHLGINSEKDFLGYGVSMCATCDGPFFRNKKVLVIGGGNTALEEANFLASIASKVTIIHRKDKFRAEKAMQDKIALKKNIEVFWNTELVEIIGNNNQKYVTHANLNSNGKIVNVECDGIFIAIGHKPSTDFLKNFVQLDNEGYVVLSKDSHYSSMTSVNGIFAAGDVCDKVYRQAVTAAGMGCMASIDAQEWLSK